MSIVEKRKKPWKKLLPVSLAFMVTALFVPAASLTANAAGVDNAVIRRKTVLTVFSSGCRRMPRQLMKKEDAEITAQIISNTISGEYESKVFNDGHIFGGSHNITYADLLAATSIGAENDSTSIDMFKAAVGFISSGNKYRAKESLPALKISSALMAMGELNCNYQDICCYGSFKCVLLHGKSCLQATALNMEDGTIDGKSDNPYEGWYEEEKQL